MTHFRSLGQKSKNSLVFGSNENRKIFFWNSLTFRVCSRYIFRQFFNDFWLKIFVISWQISVHLISDISQLIYLFLANLPICLVLLYGGNWFWRVIVLYLSKFFWDLTKITFSQLNFVIRLISKTFSNGPKNLGNTKSVDG